MMTRSPTVSRSLFVCSRGKNRERARLPPCIHAARALSRFTDFRRGKRTTERLTVVSESIIVDGMRVTLLDARRLSPRRDRLSAATHPIYGAAAGFTLRFSSRTRLGQTIPAVLGEIRVLIGSATLQLGHQRELFKSRSLLSSSSRTLNTSSTEPSMGSRFESRYGHVQSHCGCRRGIHPRRSRSGRHNLCSRARAGGHAFAGAATLRRPLRKDDVAYHWFDSVSRRLIDLPEHNPPQDRPAHGTGTVRVEDAIQFDQGAGRKTPSRYRRSMRHTYRHSDILETCQSTRRADRPRAPSQ